MLTNKKIEANFSKLKEQFLSYSKEIQAELMNSELEYDVMLAGAKSQSKHLFVRRRNADWHTYRRHGISSPNGDFDTRAEAHIRHNVYRTLFVLSLDCDFEQKVKILAKTCKIEGADKNIVYSICESRLKNCENILNNTLEI